MIEQGRTIIPLTVTDTGTPHNGRWAQTVQKYVTNSLISNPPTVIQLTGSAGVYRGVETASDCSLRLGDIVSAQVGGNGEKPSLIAFNAAACLDCLVKLMCQHYREDIPLNAQEVVAQPVEV